MVHVCAGGLRAFGASGLFPAEESRARRGLGGVVGVGGLCVCEGGTKERRRVDIQTAQQQAARGTDDGETARLDFSGAGSQCATEERRGVCVPEQPFGTGTEGEWPLLERKAGGRGCGQCRVGQRRAGGERVRASRGESGRVRAAERQ